MRSIPHLGYNKWYRVFCGSAVINSVFSQLREKVGEPHKSFPAGANIVANCIIGPRISGAHEDHQIAADLMQWYSETALPVYMPKKPKITEKILTTTSDSPLCHLSVGKWMKASGYPLKSAERKDRCARVAASTAYRLVELLNAWKDGKYVSSGDFSCAKEFGITGQFNCGDCHGADVPEPPTLKKS